MKATGFMFAIGAALTWGVVYTMDQRLLLRLTPTSLLFVNSALSLLLTTPLMFQRTSEIGAVTAATRDVSWLVIGSLILAVAANYFIYSAIRLVGAATASTFEITYPFFVVAFSAIWLHQPITRMFLLGTILIFSGVFLIMKWGS